MKSTKNLSILNPTITIDLSDGQMTGESVIETKKRLKELYPIYEDKQALTTIDAEKTVYEVQAFLPVKEGREGGLYYGKTVIYPGKVGDEYFMTKGHFHNKANRAEFYWGIQGEGLLLLMDKERNTWAEKMYPGSLHYIDEFIAHRTVNTGDTPLIFGACWPSDAGHNYQEILDKGFSASVKEINGKPKLFKS